MEKKKKNSSELETKLLWTRHLRQDDNTCGIAVFSLLILYLDYFNLFLPFKDYSTEQLYLDMTKSYNCYEIIKTINIKVSRVYKTLANFKIIFMIQILISRVVKTQSYQCTKAYHQTTYCKYLQALYGQTKAPIPCVMRAI